MISRDTDNAQINRRIALVKHENSEMDETIEEMERTISNMIHKSKRHKDKYKIALEISKHYADQKLKWLDIITDLLKTFMILSVTIVVGILSLKGSGSNFEVSIIPFLVVFSVTLLAMVATLYFRGKLVNYFYEKHIAILDIYKMENEIDELSRKILNAKSESLNIKKMLDKVRDKK